MEVSMLEKSPAENKERIDAEARDRREKFVELAESRTRTAIKAIRTIAKLGNKNAYEYTETDVKKIAGALNREIEALRARMTSSGGKESVDFKL
jgi:ribosomal protein L7/L12